MDPFTLALIGAGITAGSSLLGGLVDLIFGAEGREEQRQAGTEQFNLEEQALEAEASFLDESEAQAERAFQEQQTMFDQQAGAFQGAQRQAISMAGVSLQSGSPLAAQMQAAQTIEADRAALLDQQNLQSSQFDVAREQLRAQQGNLATQRTQFEQQTNEGNVLLNNLLLNPLQSVFGSLPSLGTAAGQSAAMAPRPSITPGYQSTARRNPYSGNRNPYAIPAYTPTATQNPYGSF